MKIICNYIHDIAKYTESKIAILSSGLFYILSLIFKAQIEKLNWNQPLIARLAFLVLVLAFAYANYKIYKDHVDEINDLRNNDKGLALYFEDLFSYGRLILKNKEIIIRPEINEEMIKRGVERRKAIWNEYKNTYERNKKTIDNNVETMKETNIFEQENLFTEYLQKYENYLNKLYLFVNGLINHSYISIFIKNDGKSATKPAKIHIIFPDRIHVYSEEYGRELLKDLEAMKPPDFPNIEQLISYINSSNDIRKEINNDYQVFSRLNNYFGEEVKVFYSILMSTSIHYSEKKFIDYGGRLKGVELNINYPKSLLRLDGQSSLISLIIGTYNLHYGNHEIKWEIIENGSEEVRVGKLELEINRGKEK